MQRVTPVLLSLLLSSCLSSDKPVPVVQPPSPTQSPASAPRRATPQREQWLEMFARGYFPGRSGQVFVVPKENWFVTSHDPLYLFMHGSPWNYDTQIPVLFMARHSSRPFSIRRPPSSRTLRPRSVR